MSQTNNVTEFMFLIVYLVWTSSAQEMLHSAACERNSGETGAALQVRPLMHKISVIMLGNCVSYHTSTWIKLNGNCCNLTEIQSVVK